MQHGREHMGTESREKSGAVTEGALGEPSTPTAAASPGAGPTFHIHIEGSTIGAIGAGTGLSVTGSVNTSGQPASPQVPGTSSAGPSPERGPADRPIDFAILTAIEVERRAVCAAFGLKDTDRVKKDARVYWRGRLPLKDGSSYEIVVAQSPDMANIDSALLTNDMLHHWRPGAALLVGIAASAHKDVKLGDVVVASDVYYYERGKVTPERKKPEPKILPADATLWANVSALPDWDGSVHVPRLDGSNAQPKVHRDVIASGEKVIADVAIRDEIASGHRKIIAIAMEEYGFSRAVWQNFDRVRHLVIRGICDDGSPAKDDKWHKYAAASAAAFAKHFLLDRPLEPRTGVLPPGP